MKRGHENVTGWNPFSFRLALNLDFSFSILCCQIKARELNRRRCLSLYCVCRINAILTFAIRFQTSVQLADRGRLAVIQRRSLRKYLWWMIVFNYHNIHTRTSSQSGLRKWDCLSGRIVQFATYTTVLTSASRKLTTPQGTNLVIQ